MKHFTQYLLLIFVLSFISCQHDEPKVDPSQEVFPIQYHFVNRTLHSIRAVNFTAFTYFPKINQTYLHYQYFPRVAGTDTVSIGVDATGSTKWLGYIGCTQQMEINLYYDINDSITYQSIWFTKIDTLHTKQDAQIFFYWPSDTLKARKTQSHYYNRLRNPFYGD